VDLAFYHEKKPAAFYGGLQLSLLLEKVRCEGERERERERAEEASVCEL
jgi:hypothetical protein